MNEQKAESIRRQIVDTYAKSIKPLTGEGELIQILPAQAGKILNSTLPE